MTRQELNRKLAEWAGFKFSAKSENIRFGSPQPLYSTADYWIYPDGKYHRTLPNFPQSLDACFAWLVPKADSLSWFTQLRSHVYNDSPNNPSYETVLTQGMARVIVYNLNPALALCLAIEKLIDKDKEVKDVPTTAE